MEKETEPLSIKPTNLIKIGNPSVTSSNILLSSEAWVPCPPLPPDKDWNPVLPVVAVFASHSECLKVTASTPPPPPATIKDVLVPLTTNVPPQPPDVELWYNLYTHWLRSH